MSTELATFDKSFLPSFMQDAIQSGEMEQTLQQRNQLNQLTFRGKVWRAVVNGEDHVQTNADGDPVSTIKVLIFKKNSARSRAYYEGEFKEGENRAPACWSSNGQVPDAEVKEPIGSTCADCPMAAKGSRVTNTGKAGVACTSFKNLVVVPASDLKFPALRLRLPQTSIWDKDTEGQQWMAFDQYEDFLRSKGIPNLAVIVTKIKFDPDRAFPKLLFSPDFEHDEKNKAFLNKDEFEIVKQRLKDENFSTLLGTAPISGEAKPAIAATPTPKLTPVPALDKEPPVKAEAPPAPTPAAEPAATPTVNAGLASLVDNWDD